MYEFRLLSIAYQVKLHDQQFDSAYQAWMNQQVQATKGSGKNVKSAYKTFDDFFNNKKQFERIFVPEKDKKRRLTMAEKNRLLNGRR
jgi:hypothetical protein